MCWMRLSFLKNPYFSDNYYKHLTFSVVFLTDDGPGEWRENCEERCKGRRTIYNQHQRKHCLIQVGLHSSCINSHISMLCTSTYDPSQYQFGNDVTSASFVFNWTCGRGAMLTRAARRYACCEYTEQALILSDVTTILLVTWIIESKFMTNNVCF